MSKVRAIITSLIWFGITSECHDVHYRCLVNGISIVLGSVTSAPTITDKTTRQTPTPLSILIIAAGSSAGVIVIIAVLIIVGIVWRRRHNITIYYMIFLKSLTHSLTHSVTLYVFMFSFICVCGGGGGRVCVCMRTYWKDIIYSCIVHNYVTMETNNFK